MSDAAGEAPGKILLMGEHAAVYGHPAIAIPLHGVHARAEVSFKSESAIELYSKELDERASSDDGASDELGPLIRLARSVMDFFGEKKQGLLIELRSSIPMRRGMGSGAAAAVAIVRGICNALRRRLDADQVAELALEAEREFHGNPSGVDCAVIARGEPIYFVRNKPPQEIVIGPNRFTFVVADTGIDSPTLSAVEYVRAAREKSRARFDSLFWELGSMASVAREVIRAGSPAELGVCMTHAHGILREIGVSSPELDALVNAALHHGALGAKLSGAGRGGAIVSLVEDEDNVEHLAEKLRSAGAETIITTRLEKQPV